MRTTTLLGLSAASLAADLPSPALADDRVPIVVTGRGLADTPATPAYDVVTLDRAVLARAASGRLEDSLANIAGFQQFRRSDSRSSNPSAQGVTLRALGGNATSRALVLLDGVPMADPFFGYIPFSAIDPGQLARIRVTRGGGSSAFGAGAVAGTIELESAGADQLGLVNAAALVNDRGETELSASLAPTLGAGYAVITGRWDRGQGFFTSREPDVFLEEVHRQAADSPIIWLATMAREGKPLPLGRWDAGELGFAQVLPHNAETQCELYREDTQALCGLHRVRIGYTQRIRRRRGFEGPRPMPGETVLVRKNDRDLAIFNGTLGRLMTAPRPYKRRAGDDEADAKLIHLEIDTDDGLQVEALTDPYLFDRHFREVPEPRYRKGIQWVDWGNVLTMHSAQGSEWPDVTVVDDGGAFREDQHRWRYVGLTRASERVTFLRRMG